MADLSEQFQIFLTNPAQRSSILRRIHGLWVQKKIAAKDVDALERNTVAQVGRQYRAVTDLLRKYAPGKDLPQLDALLNTVVVEDTALLKKVMRRQSSASSLDTPYTPPPLDDIEAEMDRVFGPLPPGAVKKPAFDLEDEGVDPIPFPLPR